MNRLAPIVGAGAWRAYRRRCLPAACVVLGGLFGAVTPDLVSGATIASAKPATDDVGPTFGHDPLHSGVFGLLVGSGSQLFAASPGGRLQASSAVAAGTLYFDSGGTLYAYAPSAGLRPAR